MAMSIACICGKQLNVKFEWIGKRIKCPGCGSTMVVPSDGVSTAAAPVTGANVWAPKSRTVTQEQGATPKFHISTGTKIWIGLAILIPGLILFGSLGPKRVVKQWQVMGPIADSACRDVVTRVVQVYLQQNGGYDPTDPRHPPGVRDLDMMWSDMHITMPKKVGFIGHTSEGDLFSGYYYTRTGEVVADVKIGGMPIKATGRINNGNVEAEIDGKPANLDLTNRHSPD
jgi:ribosomal protein S27E